jgi:hypothetical protein
MPKRERRSSAEIIYVNANGTAIVEHAGKQYFWHIPEDVILDRLTDTNEFEISIIHNREHRAMIDIMSVRKDECYLRQEINPLKYKDSEEWVVDSSE